MIKIYTSLNDARESAKATGKKFILINDLEFEMQVGRDNIDSVDKEIMQKIDNAKLMGDGIITPFGETTMYNLSTGCKTAINIHHALRDSRNVIINISECEGKALDVALELTDNTNVELVLIHAFIKGLMEKEYRFNVLNKGIKDCDIYELTEVIRRSI